MEIACGEIIAAGILYLPGEGKLRVVWKEAVSTFLRRKISKIEILFFRNFTFYWILRSIKKNSPHVWRSKQTRI